MLTETVNSFAFLSHYVLNYNKMTLLIIYLRVVFLQCEESIHICCKIKGNSE